MKPIRIAMWSGPRNISTALMRSFENRSDTFITDEPFYAHYLQQTGVEHPMRNEVIEAGNSDWDEVSQYLTGAIPNGKSVWYQKHMAQHNLQGADLNWTEKLTNCFLIRDPIEVILSYSKKYEITSTYQLGYPQQVLLFNQLKNKNEANVIVLDSKDILQNPKKLLKLLCKELDIPFLDKMFCWPPGKRDSDGVWGEHWYGNVEKSTKFQPYQKKGVELPAKYGDIYEQCLKKYQQLFQYRII